MWTLKQGLALICQLELIANKFNLHTILTGSVLYAGKSNKDLDIIVFKRKTTKKTNYENFKFECIKFGLVCWIERNHEHLGYTKEVYATTFKGKRVDIFLL